MRSNCLEGLTLVFESLPLDEAFYSFLLKHTGDPDSRVKGVALKGLGTFAGEDTTELWNHALDACSAQEELESLLWTLEGLQLQEAFQDKIIRLRKKFEKVSKAPLHKDTDDETIITLRDKDQI